MELLTVREMVTRETWRAKERWMQRGNFRHTADYALCIAWVDEMTGEKAIAYPRWKCDCWHCVASECPSFPSVENELIYNVQEVCVVQTLQPNSKVFSLAHQKNIKMLQFLIFGLFLYCGNTVCLKIETSFFSSWFKSSKNATFQWNISSTQL